MSRWADLFADLSSASDKADTTDTTSNEEGFVGCVTSVTPPPDATIDLGSGGFVNCVRSVNAPAARKRANDVGPPLEENATDGSIPGQIIDGVLNCQARDRAPLTLRTQLTQWAEVIGRLDPNHPRGDVPLWRWQKLLADARRLIDDGVVAQATAAGWSAHDLFGCDATKPFARLDQMGLAWFVKGACVVSTSMSAAVIETQTGARQTYRRKAGAPGRILVWELE
jgi:hypothetical protein